MNRIYKNSSLAPLFLLLAFMVLPANVGHAAENPRIAEGSKVTFLYVVTVPGSVVVDLRDVGEFIQGQHQILPALEREMDGMKAGEEKSVELSAEQGFGRYDAMKRKEVSPIDLPVGTKKGDILQDKQGRPAIVTEMSESVAVLDYNHPLAGQTVFVQLKVLKVEDPS